MDPSKSPQQVAITELCEWREDVADGVGSRVVLLPVPVGWGKSTVLDQFAAEILGEQGDSFTFLFRIAGQELSQGRGPQAEDLCDVMTNAALSRPGSGAQGREAAAFWERALRKLDLDRPAGVAGVVLGLAGFFLSGPAATAGIFLAQEAAIAVGNTWELEQARPVRRLAQLARAASQASAQGPVVVLIDDADSIDLDLCLWLVENLTFREDGQMLVVVAAELGGPVAVALRGRGRGWPAGQAFVVGVDDDQFPESDIGDMGFAQRLALVHQLCPDLDGALARRIGQRTATFGEVFAVATSELVAELSGAGTDPRSFGRLDGLISSTLCRPEPSPEAVLVAWAGGAMHVRQVARALPTADLARLREDPHLVVSGGGSGPVVRLVDPASAEIDNRKAALTLREQREMASAIIDEAIDICTDQAQPIVDRIVAGRAAHRIPQEGLTRDDRHDLISVECVVVADLETVGDLAEADQVAEEALAGCSDDQEHASARDNLMAARLRLAAVTRNPVPDPVVQALISEAFERGATIGLEARVWADASLLAMPDRREDARSLAEQIIAELDGNDVRPDAARWRLSLACQAGRTGFPDVMNRLLTPLLASDDAEQQDVAARMLRAADGEHADLRLRVALFHVELEASSSDDDRLRIHDALADLHRTLGEYSQALDHASRAVDFHVRLQGASHPATLSARLMAATCTGLAGDSRAAVRQFSELLPGVIGALGQKHPLTLAVRAEFAIWTARSGDPVGALMLFTELLADAQRVFGRDDQATFKIRANIASLTSRCGNKPEARRLTSGLLADRERVLGHVHPDTLTTRNNLAYLIGESGDWEAALRLFSALLLDRQRVLGHDHPDTLTTRANVATSTGESENPDEALRLFIELLPDRERVLGHDHPDTLTTRQNIAYWTGRCGDSDGKLRILEELLPDRQRVLGVSHPDTISTQMSIAALTGGGAEDDLMLRMIMDQLSQMFPGFGQPGQPA